MNDIMAKIEALEKSIELQFKKSKSGIIWTSVIYIVIIIFVFAYTSFIMHELRVLAKPPVVAEFIVGQVQSRIPLATANLKKNSNAYADALADKTVAYIRSFIPLIGNMAKGQLDTTAQMINVQMDEQYLPIIEDYFKANKAQITEMFNTMTDEQVALQMNNILFEKLDKNVALLNGPIADTVNELKAKIDKLANTPNSQLTNQELAQKRIIAYWIYLVKYQKPTGFKTIKF
ncbi:MAG: hypothetical protein WCR55_00740 [Lentisphaerota bacterium]